MFMDILLTWFYPDLIIIIIIISHVYVHSTDVFSDLFSISLTFNLTMPRSQTDATVTFWKYHKNEMK